MLCLSAGAGLAQDEKLTQFQSQVRDLMRQLEKAPKYFDEPLKSNLNP